MNEVQKFFENIDKMKIINSIIVVLLSILAYRLICYVIKKGEQREKSKFINGKRSKTYLNLVRSIVKYAFIILTTLILFQINGIDVSSVLTGVGLIGAVLGFAIQDWIKDVIRGSTIISDEYCSVGDLVKYRDVEGKVLSVGIKSMKIQDIKTGNIKTIANRNIEEIDIVSNLIYIKVPMPYELPLDKAEKMISNMVENIKKNEDVSDSKYKGVTEFADSSIDYLIEITCNQFRKLQVRRDALRTILAEMEKNGISVPYTQIDIHNK